MSKLKAESRKRQSPGNAQYHQLLKQYHDLSEKHAAVRNLVEMREKRLGFNPDNPEVKTLGERLVCVLGALEGQNSAAQSEISGLKIRSQMLEELTKAIEQHDKNQWAQMGGPIVERAKHILGGYANRTAQTLDGARGFRDDVLTYFRAMAMVIEMIGNAETHGEKKARTRGAIELLEMATHRLRQENFQFLSTSYRTRSAFESDFPTREFKERIFELERQLEEAQKANPAQEQTEDAK